MRDGSDPEEARLRELLRRSDGPSLVHPLAWSRPRRSGRTLVSATVVALVVVTAVVVGTAWERRSHDVAATPQPSGGASVVLPTGSPAQPGQTWLLVNLGGNGIGLRTEADATPFFRVDNRTQYAISGTRLAYWKTGVDDALPHELHIYDVSTRSDRTVLTLTDERAGTAGFMAWSVDGQGLAIATHTKESAYEGRLGPAVPSNSSWRLIDLTTGSSRVIGSISGAWLIPLSWDRSSGIATATEAGRDGPSAPVRRFYEFSEAATAMQQLPLPGPLEPLSIVVDTGAQAALGIENRVCSGVPCRVLWHWRLTDVYGAESRVPPDLLWTAAFRPGTSDVYVAVRKAGSVLAPIRIEDWGSEAKTLPPRVVVSSAPTGGWFFFPPDGGALIMPNLDPSAHRALVVDPLGATTSEFTFFDDPMAALGASAPPARLVAVFPMDWLLTGTQDGRVFRGLVPAGSVIPPGSQSWKICSDPVRRILAAPGSSRVLVTCGDVAADQSGFLLDAELLAGGPGRVRPLSGPISGNVVWSPDGRSLLYTTIGSCEPSAPICKQRVWLRDLTNGEPIDPPRLLLEDYNLGAVNWTPLGPSIFKPQMSNNGIRQPADAGTFLYDGSAWRRYSLHEVLDAIRNGPVLLAAELTGSTDRRGGGVVVRIGAQETRWTPADVSDETPLALLDDGRVLAWRAGSVPFRGQLVSYRDGKQIAADDGAFAAVANIRAGIFGEWILGQEFSGAPSLRLHTYSISAHAFASIQPSTTAVGAIVVGATHR